VVELDEAPPASPKSIRPKACPSLEYSICASDKSHVFDFAKPHMRGREGQRERASEINLGTGYRRSGRTVALGAAVAAFLAGCGGESETVTGDPSASSSVAAPATEGEDSPAWGPVTASVMQSVLPVFCSDANAADGFVGTAFRVSNGAVTASHVVAACRPGTTISIGGGTGTGTVSTNDRTHDLALVKYQRPWDPMQNTDPDPTPLRLESRAAHVGEPLALLGIPEFPLLGNPFKRQVTVVTGHVLATNRTQVLRSDTETPETLKDAIEVVVPGVAPGESGGPAIDLAGRLWA
jgi:S1-C subfamily serine protease